jgi:pantetheine-phosphate adenylyltransferase
MKYHRVALGGTFDHFHAGHKAFLGHAASLAPELIIGITRPSMLIHKKYPKTIESFSQRGKSVSDYLNMNAPSHRVQFVPLEDIYGPTVSDPGINALVVSPATHSNAEKINQERQNNTLPPLSIEVVSPVLDSLGDFISSSRIRAGVVNREGLRYETVFSKSLTIHPDQKKQMNPPTFARIIQTQDIKALVQKAAQTIIVGDHLTQTFNDHSIPFNLAIIDNHINRHPHEITWNKPRPNKLATLTNPAGTIQAKAAHQIFTSIAHDSYGYLEIVGEEDLLGFPSLLAAPLSSLILYGQPGKGIGAIWASEENKHAALLLLTSS